MKPNRVGRQQIVLLGVGHTNAHIVRMWQMSPIPDAELTCISNAGIATYSGMLPAVLAGQIPRPAMEIDLVQLCAASGARLLIDNVIRIDSQNHLLHFSDRPALPFDALSIGIGSVPDVASLGHKESESLIKIKPMQSFLERLASRVDELRDRSEPIQAVIVGGGVAGVEITFCLYEYLRSNNVNGTLELLTRSTEVLPDSLDSTRRKVLRELEHRNIRVTAGRSVTQADKAQLTLDDGSTRPGNLVIWATGATAPPAIHAWDLPKDERGFLATDRCLAVLNSYEPQQRKAIFAVGDTGTIVENPAPKAGVYAVRQGHVLWENLQRVADGRPLVDFHPQSSFLRLMNLGNGTAIGQWKQFSAQGAWVYRLKHWIDSSFIEKYRPKPMAEDAAAGPMKCDGCGCKLESAALEQGLTEQIAAGRRAYEDAAAIGPRVRPLNEPRLETSEEYSTTAPSGHEVWLASTDFFSSPVRDPFLFGRICAVHASSDLLACGARVKQALSNVVLPEGHSGTQSQMLTEFTAGATREFHHLGARIVGGHTCVGPRFEAGFTVIGPASTDEAGEFPLRKSGLHAEDRLYLSKPIGIGVLLAAHMRAACPAKAYVRLIESMLSSHQALVGSATAFGICAATDVTGYGLAGHLIEMLLASNVAAEISLSSIPSLDGSVALIKSGIESSLAPSNALAAASHIDSAKDAEATKMRLLFDPQTCGGILLGVSPDIEAAWLQELNKQGIAAPFPIGRALPLKDRQSLLTIRA